MFVRNINSILMEHQTGVMEGTDSNPNENLNALLFLLFCNALTINSITRTILYYFSLYLQFIYMI